ncbi:hypothetical protein [Paenibacillus ihuae]|uniref:hypothetical protein n=1 Tax=Paenibacillus ihuae TaxID=1232431 RepID=UPI0006D55C08|nr:hypothetical protein [Paenibacillus ihuae]
MKTQPDQNRITLLVVREAGRPVRQLQLSKPLALAIPAAAALSISSLVTSMHFHASRSIAELEAEAASLSLTNLRMEMKVADKEQTLQQLRSQVTELSEEAENIRDKLKSVDELEAQLQYLINPDGHTGRDTDSETDPVSTSMSTPGTLSGTLPAADTAASSARKYGVAFAAEPEPAAASSSLSAVSFRLGAITSAFNSTVAPQVGGEYIAVYQDDPMELVQETRDDYAEIRSLLEEMVTSITTTITEAREAKSAEAQLQAKKALAEKNAWRRPSSGLPTPK